MNYEALLEKAREETDSRMSLMYHPATLSAHAEERDALVLRTYLNLIQPLYIVEADRLVGDVVIR